MKKKIPIGISDFKLLIEEKYTYVDKTLLIQELVDKGVGKISLIPRMRRFGKTLNLSMLRYFFEKTHQDTSYLFSELNIWKMERYKALQGQFPVIFLSLKDIKYSTWEDTLDAFQICIAQEYERHRYLLDSDKLSLEEKKDYHLILRKEAPQALLVQSLLMLSRFLESFYKRRVVLLIDEYDTPVHPAYIEEYYDPCIKFLRNWLTACLKDNSSLEFGVLTGILRIAKESIFSGLNNISTYSLLNKGFQDKFGFLGSEVRALLKQYELKDKLDEIRSWYNGYQIGTETEVYNPWSVLKCIEAEGKLSPYWVNTSENAIMTRLITRGADTIKKDVEELVRGGVIKKKIEEDIAFTELELRPHVIWSLLLFSGYLTVLGPVEDGSTYRLRIPNEEVNSLYRGMILSWFEKSISEENYSLLLKSLVTGDMNTFSLLFQEFLLTAFSVFDVTQDQPERIYHAFVLGMLVGLEKRYEVRSNRESGFGRYDVILFPKDVHDLGIVLEFKKMDASEDDDFETAVESALKQIEDKQYATELYARGVGSVLLIGLAFKGKKVFIKSRQRHR